MKGDKLHQDTSIVYGQGVVFEALNQRRAVFSAEVDLFWSLDRGLHHSD
jgi:hypothetical protein